MTEATCHCGAVRLQAAHPPAEETQCNCSLCRRYGVLWAYYVPDQVRVIAVAGTETYAWDDRAVAFHRCRTCGCVTHWTSLTGDTTRMGVNARLIDPDLVARARLRLLDGAVTEAYLD
jgi:hypothetical protein